MPVVAVRGAELHYEESGTGSPVVFLHGGGGDLSQWRHQMPAFAARHRAIAFDARGHGKSKVTARPYGMEDFARDLAGLLAHLGVDGAHLVGATLGGVAALEFALERPRAVRSLVLVSTAPDTTDEMRARFEASAEVAESGDLEGFAEGYVNFIFTPAYVERCPQEAEDFRRRLAAIDGAEYARSIRALGNRQDLGPRLHRLAAPALIVTGAMDPIPTSAPGAELLARAMPHARAEVIPDAAHLPQVEQPAIFNRLALDFIAVADRQAA